MGRIRRSRKGTRTETSTSKRASKRLDTALEDAKRKVTYGPTLNRLSAESDDARSGLNSGAEFANAGGEESEPDWTDSAAVAECTMDTWSSAAASTIQPIEKEPVCEQFCKDGRGRSSGAGTAKITEEEPERKPDKRSGACLKPGSRTRIPPEKNPRIGGRSRCDEEEKAGNKEKSTSCKQRRLE